MSHLAINYSPIYVMTKLE